MNPVADKILWAKREDWDYEAYSLNIRLYRMADDERVASNLAIECSAKFNREPDLTPQASDRTYFRNAGMRRRRQGKFA